MSTSEFSQYSHFDPQFSAQPEPDLGQSTTLHHANIKDVRAFKTQLESGHANDAQLQPTERLAKALLALKPSSQFSAAPDLKALLLLLPEGTAKNANANTSASATHTAKLADSHTNNELHGDLPAVFAAGVKEQGLTRTVNQLMQAYQSLQYGAQLSTLFDNSVANEDVQAFKHQAMEQLDIRTTAQLTSRMTASFTQSCTQGAQSLLHGLNVHDAQDLQVKLLAAGGIPPTVDNALQGLLLQGLAYKLAALLKGLTGTAVDASMAEHLGTILLKQANGDLGGSISAALGQRYEHFKKTDKAFTSLDLQVSKALEKVLLQDKAVLQDNAYTPSKSDLVQALLGQYHDAFHSTAPGSGAGHAHTANAQDLNHINIPFENNNAIDKAVINFDLAIFCDTIKRHNGAQGDHGGAQTGSDSTQDEQAKHQQHTDALIDDVCKQISVSDKDQNQAWAVRIELKDELFKNVIVDMKGDYYKIEVLVQAPDADESTLFLKLIDDLKKSLETSSNKDIYVKVDTQ